MKARKTVFESYALRYVLLEMIRLSGMQSPRSVPYTWAASLHLMLLWFQPISFTINSKSSSHFLTNLIFFRGERSEDDCYPRLFRWSLLVLLRRRHLSSSSPCNENFWKHSCTRDQMRHFGMLRLLCSPCHTQIALILFAYGVFLSEGAVPFLKDCEYIAKVAF